MLFSISTSNDCQLDENDFQFLYKSHFVFKNKISEEASLDSIDGYFEYDEVEYVSTQ